eukprot:TRINITY_DN1860_c0_g1_i1.p1 TRINITY_DN1860_c0_g1~~TRINITY_DN1860_c0_g1_i1.p1  ORF type:complete len:463 (-),score=130.80 TRINITY_DN1860_c0_g1_i1:111-1499(-)
MEDSSKSSKVRPRSDDLVAELMNDHPSGQEDVEHDHQIIGQHDDDKFLLPDKVDDEVDPQDSGKKEEKSDKKRKYMHCTDDVRQIIYNMAIDDGKSPSEIAQSLHLCVSTVQKMVKKFREDGVFTPKKHAGGRPRALVDDELSRLSRYHALQPLTTMAELARKHAEWTGKIVNAKTLHDNLSTRHGFRKSDFISLPPNRNSPMAIEARYHYCFDVIKRRDELFNAIYIDEATWALVKPGKGWSLKGIRPVGIFEKRYLVAHTLLVAMVPSIGIIHKEVVGGKVDETTFCSFLDSVLENIPHREDGTTPSLVVMDNAFIHKCDPTLEWFRDHPHMRLLYLPPFSPFLNPVDECCADWKMNYCMFAKQRRSPLLESLNRRELIALSGKDIDQPTCDSYLLHAIEMMQIGIDRKPVGQDMIREHFNDSMAADDYLLFDAMDGLPIDDVEDVVSDPYHEFFPDQSE